MLEDKKSFSQRHKEKKKKDKEKISSAKESFPRTRVAAILFGVFHPYLMIPDTTGSHEFKMFCRQHRRRLLEFSKCYSAST